MNIGLIAGNFLSKKGGITSTIFNFYDKLTKLGENVLVFNNCISKKDFYISIYSGYNIKNLLLQKFGFFFFLIKLFIKILFFKNIKLRKKLNLAFYYCFYPYDLVNRIKSLKSLVYYFNKFKIDILLSVSSSYPLFYGYILSKWFNKPIATLAHGEDFLKRYPYHLNTFILQNVEKIILSNSIMKKLFIKVHNVNKEKLEIIFRGVNIEKVDIKQSKDQLRRNLNIPQEDFVILTVSRIHYRKGIETVIHSIKNIIYENPDLNIQYYIIGEGEEEKSLQNLVKELKLEDHIAFLGSLDDNLRNQYYKLSDLFILVPNIKKSSIEGFGIVYIEANYFKLPVIGSRIGGVKSAIEDGKLGYLINPNDEKELKDKIKLIYSDRNLREKLGEYGHQRVLNYFNWNKNAILYRNTLRKII